KFDTVDLRQIVIKNDDIEIAFLEYFECFPGRINRFDRDLVRSLQYQLRYLQNRRIIINNHHEKHPTHVYLYNIYSGWNRLIKQTDMHCKRIRNRSGILIHRNLENSIHYRKD